MAASSPKISGGAFLIEEFSPDEIFTAENLSAKNTLRSPGPWMNSGQTRWSPNLEAIRQLKARHRAKRITQVR